jgi:hypothetical protein
MKRIASPDRRITVLFIATCPTMIVPLGAGCNFEVVNRPPLEDGVGTIDAQHVLVRFYNLSTEDAVDVEFHASPEPIADPDAELFVPSLRIMGQIGVAGTGLLEPGDRDSISVPCSAGLTLGTAGGSFVDNQTGEARGEGQLRWAREGAQFSCGTVITFYFSRVTEGYITDMHIN